MKNQNDDQSTQDNREVRRSRYGRKMLKCYMREKGKNRFHRSIEEKLRKYEVSGEGYEFIPVMMHYVQRYLADLPDDSKDEMDLHLARALDEIPEAREHLKIAAQRHLEIPRELKRRAFSPRYLNLDTHQRLDTAEVAGVVQRASTFTNLPVKAVANSIAPFSSLPVTATLRPTSNSQCCCCCCCCCGGGQRPPSQSTKPQADPVPTAPPNEYEITFDRLYCVDESWPEKGYHDEIYVVFGIITEEMAETGVPAWGIHTEKYEKLDDGDTRPYDGELANLRLYGFTGPKSIDSTILISAACFEADLGDISDTTKKVTAALTAAATIAGKVGGVAGWVVAGVAVIGIGIAYLIDLIGDDDKINKTISMTISEEFADGVTNSVNPHIFPPMHFDGGDDDGIYDVYLTLRRA